MKTVELTGAELDYWVGKDEDWPCNQWSTGKPMTQTEWIESHKCGNKPKPSSDWSSGGPIIERENIAICRMHGYFGGNDKEYKWTAAVDGSFSYNNDFEGTASAEGSRPLEAAMRAYVASKYGDEVPNIQMP